MAAELAYNGNTTELLVDLMQMFRDKSAIFNLSCELLLRLMKNQNQIKVLAVFLLLLTSFFRLNAKQLTCKSALMVSIIF